MNKDKYVFAQLIEFLNNNKFQRTITPLILELFD